MKNIVISVVFAAAAASAQAAADKVREFRYEDGANVLPSYRTWEFSVEEPGLYVFDIAPDDGKTAPAVREWLDGVQIGYVLNSADWKAKTARTLGRLRRFRWLEKGKYRYDLYLNCIFACELGRNQIELGNGGFRWYVESPLQESCKGLFCGLKHS